MNNGQKIARRTKAKHLIYTSTIGKTMWPTSVIKIESSCAVGSSNCVLSERDCMLVSCAAQNEKAVLKKHKQLRLEGVNASGRAEEIQKENGYMKQLHCRARKSLKNG
jgi:RNase P/RNase MRP subunit p29